MGTLIQSFAYLLILCFVTPIEGQDDEEICRMDIGFALDSSGSMGISNFDLILQFVSEFAHDLGMSAPGNHIGVVVYSNQATLEIALDEYIDPFEFQRAVMNIRYQAKETNTGAAIRMLTDDLFGGNRGDRREVANLAIVISDGGSNIGNFDVYQEAEAARRQGITMFAMGIGRRINITELSLIANDPDESYLFSITNFRDLLGHVQDLVNAACGDLPLPTRSTTTASTTSTTMSTSPSTSASTPSTPSTTESTPSTSSTTESTTTSTTTSTTSSTTPSTTPSTPSSTSSTTMSTSTTTTAPPGACERFDIAFLLDSSGSIHEDDLLAIKRFVIDFIRQVDIGPNANQIGVVSFSSEAFLDIALNDHFNRRDLEFAISRIDWMNQMTNTSGAIREMYDNFFTPVNGDRPDAENIAILLTDGHSNRDVHLTPLEAARARQNNVKLFVIGVGNNTNMRELITVASRPEYYYMNLYLEHQEFQRDYQRVIDSVCADNKPERSSFVDHQNCPSDIMLILDDSRVSQAEWDLMLLSMVHLVERLTIGPDHQQIAVITIGGGANMHISLDDRQTEDNLRNRIRQIRAFNAPGDPVEGIMLARELFGTTDPNAVGSVTATGDRVWAKNFAILVTRDLDFYDLERLRQELDISQRQGLEVFVVVIDTYGWGADNPDEEQLNFVKLPGFSVLVNHTQVLADAVCLAQAREVWRCGFEDVNNPLCVPDQPGLPVLVQDTDDQFDWNVHTAETGSKHTGPFYAASGNWYIYMEASDPRRLHDKAGLIITPQLDGEFCLQFWYHMRGPHIGTLAVQQRAGRFDIGAIHWMLHGNQGDDWYMGAVTLRLHFYDEIVIFAVRGEAFSGDIALDDLKLTVGQCPPQYTGQWLIVDEQDMAR